ncbi:MAG: hypothetical protein IT422_07190 [Pirellulaceae bacterium]|nr:hypothetical protein [Pirellulaceae bacterium]
MLASILIGGTIVVWLRLATPNFVIPQVWKLLLIFPGVVLYLLFYLSLLTIIPQRIVIRRDKIIVEHSQKRVIETSSVSKIWLYAHTSDKLRMKVRFKAHDNKHRIRTIGIASHVNLDRLCNLLPCPVIVRDARHRNPKTQTVHRTKA